MSSIQFISCETQQLLLADFGPLGLSGVVNLTTTWHGFVLVC